MAIGDLEPNACGTIGQQQHLAKAAFDFQAREFDLPVRLHVRRLQDILLKYLRRIKVQGDIAHVFNSSFQQQAESLIRLGLLPGFGGTVTFTCTLQILRLAAELLIALLVLETDTPDISPSWLDQKK